MMQKWPLVLVGIGLSQAALGANYSYNDGAAVTLDASTSFGPGDSVSISNGSTVTVDGAVFKPNSLDVGNGTIHFVNGSLMPKLITVSDGAVFDVAASATLQSEKITLNASITLGVAGQVIVSPDASGDGALDLGFGTLALAGGSVSATSIAGSGTIRGVGSVTANNTFAFTGGYDPATPYGDSGPVGTLTLSHFSSPAGLFVDVTQSGTLDADKIIAGGAADVSGAFLFLNDVVDDNGRVSNAPPQLILDADSIISAGDDVFAGIEGGFVYLDETLETLLGYQRPFVDAANGDIHLVYTPVPEPTAAMAVLGGGAALLRRRRAR
jgi:hypothetical protein